jgi:glycerophosphoryl diester phosphodiesterase
MGIHIQAHRGACAEYAENSLPAFQRAFELGVDSVELDIQLTRDQRIVAFHDEGFSPRRSGGFAGKISAFTLAQVQAVDFLDSRRLKVPNSLSKEERKIPTLEDVFQLAKKFSSVLDIEIKGSQKEIPNLLLESIYKHWTVEKTVIRSFHFKTLSRLRKLDDKISLAFLTVSGVKRLHKISDEIHPVIWAPKFSSLSKKMVLKIHAAGLKVIPWTVNKPSDWDRLIKMGVDGITTDDPARLQKHLKSLL